MAEMRLVFICQAVDQNDPILASTVRWIEEFAKKPQVEQMTVITLRGETFALPSNVEVHAIRGRNRLVTLARFYREVTRAVLRGVDCFFIYQGGPYPVLLLPFKLLMGKPIYQWKAHPYIGPMMHLYARFCDTKVFTSTRHAFPLRLPNVRVVGQGIDTAQFCIGPSPKMGNLVTVGRIAPSKQLDVMLKALAQCNHRYGTSYRLDIYGPILKMNDEYEQYLRALVEQLNLSVFVSFRGAVPQHQLPEILNRYRLFLSFSKTALDKSVVEAMACGLPVISINPCVEEILPEHLRPLLMVPATDVDNQAQTIHHLLSSDDRQLSEIGQALRNVAVRDHSVTSLIDKILTEMET
jgi:glycosyltransferase involved in cell wall biosynthesis